MSNEKVIRNIGTGMTLLIRVGMKAEISGIHSEEEGLP